MWVIAKTELHLPEAEFWGFCLRQLVALLEAQSNKVEAERTERDCLAAQICLILAEPNRDKKKHLKPFTLDDFRLFKREEKKPEPQTAEQQKGMIRLAHKMFGVIRG